MSPQARRVQLGISRLVIFWGVYLIATQFCLNPLACKHSSPHPWEDTVVNPALPRAVRVRKIHMHPGDVSQVLVRSHLPALVVCQ